MGKLGCQLQLRDRQEHRSVCWMGAEGQQASVELMYRPVVFVRTAESRILHRWQFHPSGLGWDCYTRKLSVANLSLLRFCWCRALTSPGCNDGNNWRITENFNFMDLYELDQPDSDNHVETHIFPSTTVILTGCDHDGYPECTSEWVSDSSVVASAELRMKVSATLYGWCDTTW